MKRWFSLILIGMMILSGCTQQAEQKENPSSAAEPKEESVQEEELIIGLSKPMPDRVELPEVEEELKEINDQHSVVLNGIYDIYNRNWDDPMKIDPNKFVVYYQYLRSRFPEVKEEGINKDLEENMEEVLDVVVLGRACRNTANIKNRQPIGTMYVKAPKVMDKYFTDIIADELNVKEVKFADDVESFISYSFKPQLRTVGPKYGKLLGGIRAALAEINGSKAMNDLKANGVLVLDIDGNKVELTEEDLLIETAQTEGYVTESEGETAVVLDTNLTPELIEEGFVREIISKVQTMRKEAGFEVMDKIRVSVKDNDKIIETMKANEAEIKSEVLAEDVVYGETDGYVKEWNINKEHVTLGVTKL